MTIFPSFGLWPFFSSERRKKNLSLPSFVKLFSCNIVLIAPLLASCTLPAQPVIHLSHLPDKPATESSQIEKIPSQVHFFTLTVLDKRQKTERSARIDPAQNLETFFNKALSQGFIKKGLRPADNQPGIPNPYNLQVVLLNLDCQTLSGYVSTNVQTFAAVQLTASSHYGTYSNIYRASSYTDNYLTAASQTPSEQMDMTIRLLLKNILNDPALMKFLKS